MLHDLDRELGAVGRSEAGLLDQLGGHFAVDEQGNWTAGTDDAEREAAWAEYYKEQGGAEGEVPEGAEAPEAAAAPEVADDAEG